MNCKERARNNRATNQVTRVLILNFSQHFFFNFYDHLLLNYQFFPYPYENQFLRLACRPWWLSWLERQSHDIYQLKGGGFESRRRGIFFHDFIN